MSKELYEQAQKETFIIKKEIEKNKGFSFQKEELLIWKLRYWEEVIKKYELKQSFTPPTEEEVCKALSEFIGNKVIYIDNSFQLKDAPPGSRIIVILYNDNTLGFIGFNISLPPSIVNKISRFYESRVNNDNI